MLPGDLVSHGLVRTTFTREHRVQRFDALFGAGELRGADELPEKLPPEQPVVLQLQVGTVEERDLVSVVVRGACA